eukprot:scaffold25.g5099.t1
MDAHYEPLLSAPADEEVLGGAGAAPRRQQRRHANGGAAPHGPSPPPPPEAREDGGEEGEGGYAGADTPTALLLGSEQAEAGWEPLPRNLDRFFCRLYRYWEGRGFAAILASRVLNLLALGFTVAMSALLLLYARWGALGEQCLKDDTCDIWDVAVRRHPLEGGLSPWRALCLAYLAIFSSYWVFALVHLVAEVRELAEVRAFVWRRLGLSEAQLRAATWPEMAARLVQVQASCRLCLVRPLSEHDVASRVMRRENYLIGMLNKGVLALNVPLPGLRRHFMLTKTLEWNIYWCVLDAMFDDHFRVDQAFLRAPAGLRRRFRAAALLNLLVSPFLLAFLLIYFFMKNAEQLYNHPSSLGGRAGVAEGSGARVCVGARRWSPLARWRLREFNELPHLVAHSHVARLVSFVAGSFAALLLFLTLADERLLERDLFGRQVVWWLAVLGVVLAASRALVVDGAEAAALDPELALMEVVAHTHHLPAHWRGRAHTREVCEQFQALFRFKAAIFLEASARGRAARSRQGKMEKSFLCFAATYPTWQPQGSGRQMLAAVEEGAAAAAAPAPPPGGAFAGASMLASVLAPGAAGAGAAAGPTLYTMLAPQYPQLARTYLLQQHLAAAAAAAGPRWQPGGAGGAVGSLFGSAELTLGGGDGAAPATTSPGAALALAASFAAPAGHLGREWGAVDGADARVAASQLLLQSYYEGRRRAQAPKPHPPPLQQGAAGLAPWQAPPAAAGAGWPPGSAAAAVAPGLLRSQLQQQQQQQAGCAPGGAVAAGPPARPQPTPWQQRSQQQQLQQQQAGGGAHQWAGPRSAPASAGLRASPRAPLPVHHELSVLSREASGISREASSASAPGREASGGSAPSGGALAAAAGAGAATASPREGSGSPSDLLL